MKTVLCIESETYYTNPYENLGIEASITEGKLYYVVEGLKTPDELFYNTYDFETANYIGIFKSDKFGPYELWIALQRNLKIDEILND